jgi:rhodanese-related sulfurtransferase
MFVDDKVLNINPKTLAPKQVRDILKKKPDTFILDVRPGEFPTQTYIKGTNRINMNDLPSKLNKIPKDQGIIITDAFFKQSPLAAKYLINKGYSVLGVLKGGMERWIADGYPFEEIK